MAEVTNERPMVSIMQACRLARVSRRTIYNWMEKGKIEYVRTAGGSARIFTDSLFRDANGQRLEVVTTA